MKGFTVKMVASAICPKCNLDFESYWHEIPRYVVCPHCNKWFDKYGDMHKG